MKPNHTPTPWHSKGTSIRKHIRYGEGDYEQIAETDADTYEEASANAAFIVKACNEYENDKERIKSLEQTIINLNKRIEEEKIKNCHEELVEALRTCSNALESLGGKAGEFEVEKARKALAKAESL